MIVTDAALVAMPRSSRSPIRALCSFLGLNTLTDDRNDATEHDAGPVLPPDWQQARVAAHRAIAAADRGEVAAADAYFTTAFSLDRALQPAQIARFWDMTLSGLETAERALRSPGRYDDAAALASEVAFRFAGHPTRRPSQAAS